MYAIKLNFILLSLRARETDYTRGLCRRSVRAGKTTVKLTKGRGSRVAGRGSRIAGKKSQVAGKRSRVEKSV